MPYTMLGYYNGRRLIAGILNEPPTSPSLGVAYIIGTSPTGVWADNTDRIAVWNGEGWRYYCPDLGLRFYNAATQEYIYTNGNGWLEWPPEVNPAYGPTITVSATQPSNPQAGDLWVDTEP